VVWAQAPVLTLYRGYSCTSSTSAIRVAFQHSRSRFPCVEFPTGLALYVVHIRAKAVRLWRG